MDLFGRVRSLTREALETAVADEETRRRALISQIATDYLTLIADRQALQVTKETLDSQRHTYALEQLLVEKGSGTAQSVVKAESSVRTAEASLAQYTRQVAQDRNALFLVLGAPPPPACRPTCFSGARTSARLSTRCWPPMPASAPRGRTSFPS